MTDYLKTFEYVVKDQLNRIEEMKQRAEFTDYSKLDKIVFGIIAGDGIGPIIVHEATRVLNILLADEIASGKVELRTIEGLTLENRIARMESVPADILEQIMQCNVLLKGPTTTPDKNANLPNLESANVTLRRELDLFANVRPIRIPEQSIDWTFFRENTEGEYVLGSRGVEIGDEIAFDFKVTTNLGTRRIAKAAFEYAKSNGKTNVAIVTKANIMKKTDGKFLSICYDVAKDYPDIKVDDWYIDIMAANLVNEDLRPKFQVFLMPNLYGDILTDEAAQIQGGVGTAGSANLGSRYAMFEAVHGSAPRMVADGLAEYANPASIMKASEMMLRHVGLHQESDKLAKALEAAATDPSIHMDGGKGSTKASEFADFVIDKIKS